MTLIQLQYVLAVEEQKSINSAAKKLYVSQSSVSGAIKELETELGITLFIRNNRGIAPTKEGEDFIIYAKNVMLQFNLLQEHFSDDGSKQKERFRVSLQHSNFAAREFASLISEFGLDGYEYSIIEGSTNKVIQDVKEYRSEFGFIQINENSKEMYLRHLARESLNFHLIGKRPAYAYFSSKHPLANREVVTYEDLAEYPYLKYEQDDNSSTYFYEDFVSNSSVNNVITTYDRGTMMDLVDRINAYTIGMGIVGRNSTDLVSVRIDSDDIYIVGYITRKETKLSEIGKAYLEQLKSYL